MRCPKCGAFMEEGKDVCFMCGVNVKTYVPDNGNSQNFINTGGGAFGSGSNPAFGSGSNPAFGSGGDFNNPSMNSDFNRRKEDYNKNKSNYRNVEFTPVKNGERDIFDFFAEHKKLVTIGLCLVLGIILGLIGNVYYKHKTKIEDPQPVFRNLYYEVDESLQPVGGNNSSTVIYSKSGTKGTDCSITITGGSTTSDNHVLEFFANVRNSLEPERDNAGKVVNVLDIYTPQESSYTIDNVEWHFYNVFYKEKATTEPVVLKYRYLTSLYKGFYYDIELANNSNDASCSASLDNFVRTLKFVDVEVKEK